jgi:hypothetical protein
MSQNFCLEYACTPAEREEAQSLSLRKELGGGSKWRTRVVLALILVGVLLALYFQLREMVPAEYRAYAFAGVLVFSAGFVLWKRSTRTRRPATIVVELSERELVIVGVDSRVAMPWSAFSECLESRNLFVLKDRPERLHFIVPKRAFPSEDWQNWFRDLANHRAGPSELPPAEARAMAQSEKGDQITLNFQLGFQDYLDGTLASWRTWGVILALMGTLVGISIYSTAHPPPHAVNSPAKVFFMFVLPFMLVMSVVVIFTIAISTWRAHKKYLIPQQIVLSAKCIRLSSSDGTGTLPWTTYKYFKETRRSLILWSSHASHWLLVPKRSFPSSRDLQSCQTLLAGNLRRSRWFFG